MCGCHWTVGTVVLLVFGRKIIMKLLSYYESCSMRVVGYEILLQLFTITSTKFVSTSRNRLFVEGQLRFLAREEISEFPLWRAHDGQKEDDETSPPVQGQFCETRSTKNLALSGRKKP